MIVDATFGLGGHTRALLAAAHTTILGCDCDAEAIQVAEKFAAKVKRWSKKRREAAVHSGS